MKRLWEIIVGAFTLLIGLFFYEKNQKEKAEVKLENEKFNSQDQLLKYQQQEKQNNIVTEQQKIEELKKEHDSTTQENQKDLTPEQASEYWKNKG